MPWSQHQLKFSPFRRGFHLITGEVVRQVPEIRTTTTGLLNLFLQHTSASLTINENADPDVQVDLEASMNAIAPESFPYIHTCEGPDDMPAHVKSSLLGASLTIPIQDGQLALGTWQGIYLVEHRNRATPRRVLATVWGD
jgi:secondary thiamine-phosphate synthase enzyme